MRRGDRVRLFAYRRAPLLRVARVVAVDTAIEDVLTLPREQLESLRGTPGEPTIVYVKLAPGASTGAWERRAARILPGNAVLGTAGSNQGELNHVLDFTVRAPTFVFGMVVLAIAGLLIYVLQLMRMLERQEDLGLLRALGSRRTPLIFAESLILTALLIAAIPPGVLIGTTIAHYLASQVPTYLTDVFGFNMQVAVRPDVVAGAAALALVVAIAATIGALASARGSIAEQLGRSPQAGATVTSSISPRAALALLGGGVACLALGLLIADAGLFPPAAVTILIGLALATPGVVGLVAIGLGRREHGGSKVVLVARGAVEANPRRAALAAAIMALGVAAVVPPQLAEHSLLERIDQLNRSIRPGAQDLIASDDAFASVPVNLAYARRALRDEATVARPVAFAFVPYQGRKIEVRGLVPSTRDGLIGPGEGLASRYPLLREHPRGVLISRAMGAGLGIEPGEDILLPTAAGPRKLRIHGEVEDFAWPSGTVYMTIDRYRRLYRTDAVSAIAVDRRAKLDVAALRGLAPLARDQRSGVQGPDRRPDGKEHPGPAGDADPHPGRGPGRGRRDHRDLRLRPAARVGGAAGDGNRQRRPARGAGPGDAARDEPRRDLRRDRWNRQLPGPDAGLPRSAGVCDRQRPAARQRRAVVAAAVLIGALAAALPAWLTARAPLADALSYE